MLGLGLAKNARVRVSQVLGLAKEYPTMIIITMENKSFSAMMHASM
jgi:hypothetical protein